MRSGQDHSARNGRDERREAPRAGALSSFFDWLNSLDRLGVLRAFFGLLLVIVAGRLFFYQVIRSGELTAEAQARRTRDVTLPAKRGTIYDRNGNVLAMSEECRRLCCDTRQVEQPYLTAEVIAQFLGGTANDYVDRLTGGGYTYVAEQVDVDVADALMAELASKELFGCTLENDMRRVYPYGATASQIIGALGKSVVDDKETYVGISGLEAYYNEVLSGVDGRRVSEVGGYGTPIAGEEAQVTPAQDGTDIVISIDINVQRVAEEKIVEGVKEFKADSGSVMVTHPATGEILAACSTPLFDLTDRSVIPEGSTSLKLVSDAYEPGSIFKVLTCAIGIEMGVVTSSSTFYVPAYLEVGDDMVSDDDDRDYDMTMSLREILRRSSNTGAALVAQEEIGADAFAEGIASFGIGQLTGIDFPGEVVGFVKARDEYDGSSLGSMSFGQGLSVPLVQMVKAVGCVANHGVMVQPHFLVREAADPVAWPEGERVISENTSRQVVDMMRTVVEEGTGELAQVPGYDVAGKTGTGEMADLEHGGYVEGKYTSSLIGFAPAGNPEVLVYVGLNGTPYLAYASAAPVFSSIMSEALTDRGVLPAL